MHTVHVFVHMYMSVSDHTNHKIHNPRQETERQFLKSNSVASFSVVLCIISKGELHTVHKRRSSNDIEGSAVTQVIKSDVEIIALLMRHCQKQSGKNDFLSQKIFSHLSSYKWERLRLGNYLSKYRSHSTNTGQEVHKRKWRQTRWLRNALLDTKGKYHPKIGQAYGTGRRHLNWLGHLEALDSRNATTAGQFTTQLRRLRTDEIQRRADNWRSFRQSPAVTVCPISHKALYLVSIPAADVECISFAIPATNEQGMSFPHQLHLLLQ